MCLRVIQAFALVDREVLTADSKRAAEIESARKMLQDITSPISRKKFGIEEPVVVPTSLFMHKGHLPGIPRAPKHGADSSESQALTFSGCAFII